MAAAGKSEFGVCGVVGGMMVNELLAGTMRRGRGGIAAGEDDMRQTYTVKHIQMGLLSPRFSLPAHVAEICHSKWRIPPEYAISNGIFQLLRIWAMCYNMRHEEN